MSRDQKKLSVLLLYLEFVFCHVLKIEFIEMGKPAVPAADREMPAANSYIVGAGHVAVSAFRGFCDRPEVVTPDFCEGPRLSDIFNAGNKNPGRTAVVTLNFRLVGNRLDDLICDLPTMVAVSPEFCENEPFAHEKYWRCQGSLICCTVSGRVLPLCIHE
jgi:hypothetical protein